MRVKTGFAAIILCFNSLLHAKADTWVTADFGLWSEGSTWSTGISPNYTTSDTIIIKHYVQIDNNVFLNEYAYLRIDSNAALCGHHNMTVNRNTCVLKYGLLELDSLFIPGGTVICYPPNEVILSYYFIISTGGSLSIQGGGLSIGPWFECRPASIGFPDMLSSSHISVFPNPNDGRFDVFTGDQPPASIQIYDMTGQMVYSDTTLTSTTNRINLTRESSGIYILHVTHADRRAVICRLIME